MKARARLVSSHLKEFYFSLHPKKIKGKFDPIHLNIFEQLTCLKDNPRQPAFQVTIILLLNLNAIIWHHNLQLKNLKLETLERLKSGLNRHEVSGFHIKYFPVFDEPNILF